MSRLSGPSDDALRARLLDLGSAIDFPETPDLAPRVMARIDRAQPGFAWPRVAWAAAALVMLVGATVALSPSARDAIADLIGVPGVRVEVGQPSPLPPQGDLILGEPISIAAAISRVGFEVGLPKALGPPAAVYLQDRPGGGQVNAVYGPSTDLPRVSGANVGALLTQFRASVDTTFYKKSVAAGAVRFTAVGEAEAVWIQGEHVIAYVDPNGIVRSETARLAANVLLWEGDGITYRFESGLGLQRAVAIAASIP